MANILSPLASAIILLSILIPTIVFIVVEIASLSLHESSAVYNLLENVSPQKSNMINYEEKVTQNGVSQTLSELSFILTIIVIGAVGIGILAYVTMIRRRSP